MRVSIDWLKDYVKVKAAPEVLAEKLTMCGLEAEVLPKSRADGFDVLETEVTSNRPDWLNHIGVARELSALFHSKLEMPECRIPNGAKKIAPSTERFQVEIKDKLKCPYYSCVILEGLSDQPSPRFIQDRLTACGLRPVNLVVDVTNYVLLEFGQPLHAFDLKHLGEKKIAVRRARKGEVMKAINGTQYELLKEDLVIANQDRAVAIAGVMGGMESEVGPATTNILLESAYFEARSVRATSRRLALTTDSSYRFERGVDPAGVDLARDRAVFLIAKYGSVKKISPVFKAGQVHRKSRTVLFSMEEMEKLLGLSIAPVVVRRILTALGLSVKHRGKDLWQVTVPSFRSDLTRSVDLIEEVARLHGYDRIPETLPSGPSTGVGDSGVLSLQDAARQLLVGAGYYETVAFSLENEELLRNLGFNLEETTSIINPQNKELTVMRPTLLVGLLHSYSNNLNAGCLDVRLFEIAPVYGMESAQKLPSEEVHVASLLAGKLEMGWSGLSREVSFFDMKGLVELLLTRLGTAGFEFRPWAHPFFEEGECLSVHIENKLVGTMGTLSRRVQELMDIKQPALLSELNLNVLLDCLSASKIYKEPGKFPAARRDISMIVEEQIPALSIEEVIRRTGGPLVRKIQLFDFFHGGNVPKGSRSLAYAIEYRADDRTLTSEEVNQLHLKIGSELSAKLGAQIR